MVDTLAETLFVEDVNKVLVAAELVDLAQYHVVNRAGDLVDGAGDRVATASRIARLARLASSSTYRHRQRQPRQPSPAFRSR